MLDMDILMKATASGLLLWLLFMPCGKATSHSLMYSWFTSLVQDTALHHIARHNSLTTCIFRVGVAYAWSWTWSGWMLGPKSCVLLLLHEDCQMQESLPRAPVHWRALLVEVSLFGALVRVLAPKMRSSDSTRSLRIISEICVPACCIGCTGCVIISN